MPDLPSPEPSLRQRVIDSALALVLVALLLGISIKVLTPFLGVITYAVILATATWQPFQRLADWMGGRRRAAIAFALISGAVVAMPLYMLFNTLVDIVQLGRLWFTRIHTEGIPPLPEWLTTLPVAGGYIQAFWSTVQEDVVGVLREYAPRLDGLQGWVIEYSTGFVGTLLEMCAGIVVAAILLAGGNPVLALLEAVTARLFGAAAHTVMDAATRAVRGVAIGVVGTALIEAALGWAVFAAVGMASAPVLAGITFFIVVMQIGPILVWLPAAIWLFMQGDTTGAVIVAVYGAVVLMAVDNVLKPVLIARSGRLPILVLLLGLIGGMIAWGMTGMFIGATALAVLWTVLQTWVQPAPEAGAGTPGQS